MSSPRLLLLLLVVALLGSCGPAPREEIELGTSRQALGEPNGTFPNDSERVFHYLTNRGRLAPTSADVCGQGFSAPVTRPLEWNYNLNQSSRFHSQEMSAAGCFQHASCAFPIGTGLNTCSSAIAPDKGGSCSAGSETYCSGCASTKACTPSASTGAPPDSRLATFARFPIFGYSGASSLGENIAANQVDSRAAFCDFFLEGPENNDGQEHGHFVNIVTAGFNEVGHGYAVIPTANCASYKRYYTQDFGGRTNLPLSTIPSASHWRKPNASAETFGAIWNSAAAPASIDVVIDGICTPLTLKAGTAALGAYEANPTLGTGCHGYYFTAKNAGGTELTFPTNGSLYFGAGAACAQEYATSRTVGICGTVACTPGIACASTDGCQKGTSDCSSGQFVCGGLVNVADGTACGGGKQCGGGVCGGCVSGASCSDTSGCRKGTVSCGTGAPVCGGLSNVADNTPCPGGKFCAAGVCGACVAGAACSAPDGCATGTIDCSSGSPVCGGLSAKPDSTPCGGGKVCGSGSCGGCIPGGACTDPSNCRRGTSVCNAGASSCGNLANLSDGTSCGADQVCLAGSCNACKAGGACDDPSGDPCRKGTLSCATGKSVCSGVAVVANGAACGQDKVCNAGACNACKAGVACSDGNPCRAGFTTCSSGASVCGGLANLADGKLCNGSSVCISGACTVCIEGNACPVGDGCRIGKLRCTGAAFCGDISDAPDGTSCPRGVCSGGICGSAVVGPDAGADSGTNTADAGSPSDPVTSGCGCSAGGSGTLSLLVFLPLLSLRRRRRR